ncbi:MAG TPA: glycoside hydrolase family 2 TIM barrel-domain containing protein [Woeseiaceae bacterium]
MVYRLIILILAACTMTSCSSETRESLAPVKVEIVRTDDGYELRRGGAPYVIRGAGMAIDDIERFAAHGGNSIRNWTTDNEPQDIGALLDKAHAHGVTVMLGLPMRAERHGFDYNDSDAVARQLQSFRGAVERYRNHPALLAWIIGNELNHSYSNPAVYDAVNDVSRMIHELDPNHLTTTTVAGFRPDVFAEIEARAPDLDFISIQVYGGLFGLPAKVEAAGFDRPFMVTEWGTLGYWDMEKTAWDAPVELTSSEKADVIMRGFKENLEPLSGQVIGSHIFLWGQKQERTPTWFGLLTASGHETEAVDVMHYLWTGDWPSNRTPRVHSMTLDGRTSRNSVTIVAGMPYEAAIDVSDPDNDPLTYVWEVKYESSATQSGGDFEAQIESLDGVLSDIASARTTVTLTEPGKYRVFAYAYDGQGHAAHANIPILVEGEYAQAREDRIAGESMALSYSGFREGQHPDRGDGAVNPSREQILEDLKLLVDHEFRLLRVYDAGDNTRETLELIRQHDLPIRVLLGIWLDAEISNHEGCPWLNEPIPAEKLAANARRNAAEIQRGIDLARTYSDIVVAVSVGNEALVDWSDHVVPLEKAIAYVRQVKAAVEQPVTVADNYVWWGRHGTPLAAEVDFLGVHTYPQWEGKTIDEALAYSIENIDSVRAAHPGKPIAVLEAGWATTATEFGDRANEADQLRYFAEMGRWAEETNTTVFFFAAFDEPWKGDPGNPLGAEKHWGLFSVDRTPKQVLRKPTE